MIYHIIAILPIILFSISVPLLFNPNSRGIPTSRNYHDVEVYADYLESGDYPIISYPFFLTLSAIQSITGFAELQSIFIIGIIIMIVTGLLLYYLLIHLTESILASSIAMV